MFYRILIILFVFSFIFIGCTPVRKPLPPQRQQGNQQRPSPIPTPKGMDGQGYVDNFIIQNTLAMPGVKQANSLVIGNVAMVGVKFDDTVSVERQKTLRQEISKKVLTLHGIKDTLITSDAKNFNRIQKVSNKIRSGRSITDSWDDIDKLMSNLSTNK